MNAYMNLLAFSLHLDFWNPGKEVGKIWGVHSRTPAKRILT
jgi:hypothetical protein